jgi:hypothetical protein
MAKLLKWRVNEPPTGMYRSFAHRGWPEADYRDGRTAVCLYATDGRDYAPRLRGDDVVGLELRIRFVDYRTGHVWRTLKATAKTLAEAKKIAEDVLTAHPEVRERN